VPQFLCGVRNAARMHERDAMSRSTATPHAYPACCSACCSVCCSVLQSLCIPCIRIFFFPDADVDETHDSQYCNSSSKSGVLQSVLQCVAVCTWRTPTQRERKKIFRAFAHSSSWVASISRLLGAWRRGAPRRHRANSAAGHQGRSEWGGGGFGVQNPGVYPIFRLKLQDLGYLE